MKPTISVITPTHNRAHTLDRAWNSLNRQSDAFQIEWIIIDDGSTDDTHRLVADWQASSHFPIVYEYVDHGGKNAAVNSAQKLISGDYVVELDSDDCFKDNAFDLIRDALILYCNDSDTTLAGLGFMCDDEQGNLLHPKILDKSLRCSFLDGIFFHGLADQIRPGVGSEITYLWNREYFQHVHYPESTPPNHIPLHYAHSRLSNSYEIIYIGDIIVRRFRYDGISRITDNWPSPSPQKSLYIASQLELSYHLDYFRYKPRYFWKHAINISKFGYLCGIPLRDQFRDLPTAFSRILWTLSSPLGLAKGFVRSFKSKYLVN